MRILTVLLIAFMATGCATTSTRAIAEDGSSLQTRRITIWGAKINGSDQGAEYSGSAEGWRMSTGDTTEEQTSDSEILQLLLRGLQVTK